MDNEIMYLIIGVVGFIATIILTISNKKKGKALTNQIKAGVNLIDIAMASRTVKDFKWRFVEAVKAGLFKGNLKEAEKALLELASKHFSLLTEDMVHEIMATVEIYFSKTKDDTKELPRPF